MGPDPSSSTTALEPAWALQPTDAGRTQSSGLLGTVGRLLRGIVTLVEVVLTGEGGTLESGRFTLTVPPNALDYDAAYTMTYKTIGAVQVDLGPHGAEFDVPVTLTVDLGGTNLAGDDDVTLFWWDEASGTWVDVGGVWDPASNTLTTELEHFSRYRPGRAGW